MKTRKNKSESQSDVRNPFEISIDSSKQKPLDTSKVGYVAIFIGLLIIAILLISFRHSNRMQQSNYTIPTIESETLSGISKRSPPQAARNDMEYIAKYEHFPSKIKANMLSSRTIHPRLYRTPTCVTQTNDICIAHQCGDDKPTNLKPFRGLLLRQSRGLGPKLLTMQCLISHAYEFIYIPMDDTPQLTEWFKKALKRKESKWELLRDCELSLREYPNFFVFTFIQNPFDRALRIYIDSQHSLQSADNNFTFDTFVTDPINTIKDKTYIKTNAVTDQFLYSFHEFPKTKYESIKQFNVDNCCLCPIVDFIGTAEYFQDDLEYLLHIIDARELKDEYNSNRDFWKKIYHGKYRVEMEESLLEKHETRGVLPFRILALLYDKLGGQTVQTKVAQWFPNDFSLFGYTTDAIVENMIGLHLI